VPFFGGAPFLREIMAILDLQTYKDFIGIKSDTKDTEYMRLIHAVNQYIPNYCNRNFTEYYSTAKVEYFDGTLCEYYPEDFPIVSVTSLEYKSDETSGVYDSSLTELSHFYVDTVNSRIVSTADQFIYTSYPINSMKLTYKAGYEVIPEELKLAAAHLVEYYTEEGYVPRKSLAGASIDNVIIPDTSAKLPPHIRIVLDHYRKVVM
jgi:hypothetical protein